MFLTELKNKLEQFFNKNMFGKTHMPFIFYDKNDKKSLLFDVRHLLGWQLYCYQNNKIFKIKTKKLHSDISECNGMVYYKDGLYHLTYTCNDMTTSKRSIRYATGKTLSSIEWKEELDYEIGLVNEKYVCVGYISRSVDKGGLIHFYNHDKDTLHDCIREDNKVFSIETLWHFAKMGFIYGQPDNILVTYVPNFEALNLENTCIINVPSKTIKQIKLNNGDGSYKASIDPITNECYYAKRHTGFECRTIEVAQKDDYELIDTKKIFFC